MAGERLGEALLDLDTRDRKFNQGIDRAERKASGLGQTLDLTSEKALKIGRNLALAAAAGAAALGTLVAKVARDVAELRAEAQTAGVSFEEFQRLKYMAEQNLIGIDALTDGFKELNLRADEFIMTGQGSAAEAFERLGYTASELKQKLADPSALFSEIVDRLGKLNDAAQIRIADEIFGGTGGEQFVRLLKGGADGIARLKDEANRLGIVVSEAEGQALTEFDRTLRRITDQLGVIGQKIAIAVLPYLQEFADDLADPSFVQDAEDIAAGVAAAFGVIADAIREVLQLIAQVGEGWETVKGWVEWANTHDMLGNEIDQPLGFGSGKITPLNQGEGVLPKGDKGAVTGSRFDAAFDAASVNEGRTFKPTELRGFGLPPKSSGGGTSEIERQKQAVRDLISALEDEQAILRTSDPVQREMIRLRSTLAAATPEQTKQVEGLIEATIREQETLVSAQDAFQTFGDMGVDTLDRLLDGSGNLGDTFDDLTKSIRRMAIQAVLLGQGPLAGIFGMSTPAGGGPGGLFGALSSLFTGFHAKGGLIPNGKFGIVGDAGPEPVIGTSKGAMVLPNSTLRNMEARKDGFQFNQTIQPPDGFETRTREENTPGGKRQEVYFEEMVGSAIGRPGNAQSAVRNVGRLTRR
ncbi:phage tail tape measure protein [Roseibium aggregatum]|uniref:phage tail tape measure protein n=1 Tax=Roseibium aggregatum TaxID=187304 RepID=UPI0025AB6DCA|nr:phage tail tape measure protein [Roseibium aggregatum]WJS05210.1 phage tail tape measure protein [Roseibium aggregatum]